LTFRSTTPEEQPDVRQLLRDVFQANEDAPFLNNQHLQWKYYAERKDWPGSRSFVLSEDLRLTAHACAWPVGVLLNERKIAGFHPIDWAARSETPGTGASLLREMRKLSEISVCVGGTEVAQKVIANMGYRPAGKMKYYARPLRPWLQARTHKRRNLKLPARFARNWLWAMLWPAIGPPGWSAERVAPDQIPREVLPVSSEYVTACQRSVAQFRYFEQCPIARHELYVVRDRGKVKGYFLLSVVPGQARVADAWVNGGEIHEWDALYRLAMKTALDAYNVAEITAASALEAGQCALTRCGFRMYQALPVMLFDPERVLAGVPPVHWQMIDNDFSFLHQGRPEYAT
jgi:hypothetical protein